MNLMVVAAHVHAADTRLSRDTESQDDWTREIRLVIPVKDVELWQNGKTILERMLSFLTGDLWTIDFRSRPKGFEKIVNPPPAELLGLPFEACPCFRAAWIASSERSTSRGRKNTALCQPCR